MAPDMAALFIARGPAFRDGLTLRPFENVAINPLLRAALDWRRTPCSMTLSRRSNPAFD